MARVAMADMVAAAPAVAVVCPTGSTYMQGKVASAVAHGSRIPTLIVVDWAPQVRVARAMEAMDQAVRLESTLIPTFRVANRGQGGERGA